ncbi:hypothetical protein ACU6T3_11905 [Avibacterium paragallinarum]|uniref:hypothetical protein n=1 Tax=Avibacterium paragallinarum TaxID=728 RepID=UPI00406D23D0
MKPFNLEKALAGEPVRLSNGRKAYIKYVLGDEYSTNYPLRGFVEWKRFRDRSISIGEHSWTLKGEFAKCKENELDIVGMWEEPKPKPKRFINGIEVPEPVTEETWINGAKYYYVTLVLSIIHI